MSTAAEENVRIWECPAVDHRAEHSAHTDRSASGAASEPQDNSAAGRWGTWNAVQTIPWGVQLQHCAALTQLPGKPDWYESHWLWLDCVASKLPAGWLIEAELPCPKYALRDCWSIIWAQMACFYQSGSSCPCYV